MKKARTGPTTKQTSRNHGYDEILEELDKSMMEEMAPHVSTFIFKGEEYVQMPKRDYMAERELFLSEIRKYRGIFLKLKSTINAFDDN